VQSQAGADDSKACGFQGNAGWRRRRANPSDWVGVCALVEWLRLPQRVERFHGLLYLHSSRMPLAEANLNEPDLPLFVGKFGHECEGVCGV